MINVSVVTYLTPLNDVLNVISICSKSKSVKNIYIIDNSPNDRLSESIIKIRKVEYIHNPKNPGYGAAHNIAIKNSLLQSIPYHIVVNADVEFDYKLLEQMFLYAESIKKLD